MESPKIPERFPERPPGTRRHVIVTSQAQQLLNLADNVTLFLTPSGEAFGTVAQADHSENWPLESFEFTQRLHLMFYRETGDIAKTSAVREVIRTLQGKARLEGATIPVFVRVGEQDGKIYLDLGDDAWRVVEIGTEGWRIISGSVVKFRRCPGMNSLPVPERGGSVDELRSFINIVAESDWRLLVGWLLAALRPQGPFPIALLHGEHGTAEKYWCTNLALPD